MSSIFIKYGIMAQTGEEPAGPKAFVVDDVLPATTDLKIAWTTALNSNDWYPAANTNIVETSTGGFLLYSEDDFFRSLYYSPGSTPLYLFDSYESSCGDENDAPCDTYKYFILDTSGMNETQRTITYVDSVAATVGLTYEDLNA